MKDHPIYHVCYKCISMWKVVLIAITVHFILEIVTSWPVHHLYERLGWL